MKFGDWGEEKAKKYLERLGYQIAEQKFRCKTGEIDLIAWDGNVLCFLEVKTRSSLVYGRPSEAITRLKKLHIRRTAQFYMLLHGLSDVETRIDVIEILKVEDQIYINHIENAVG